MTGTTATPDAYLRSDPSRFDYIHFVSHAVASELVPLDSAVILSPHGTSDSAKLYARDILSKPLHAELVTISACQGSGVRAYAGEGLVGLAWAFLRAGSRNVIGALWDVSDASTPELMQHLYDGIAAGQPPDVSLRAAKAGDAAQPRSLPQAHLLGRLPALLRRRLAATRPALLRPSRYTLLIRSFAESFMTNDLRSACSRPFMKDSTAISAGVSADISSDLQARSGTASPQETATYEASVTGKMTGAQRILRACLRQPVDVTPVWFLRQAGRYMAEYQAVRRHHSLLEICRTPQLAAEVTITAAEKLDVDAAIIFADLLLPFTPMGLDFEFVQGEGPAVHNSRSNLR